MWEIDSYMIKFSNFSLQRGHKVLFESTDLIIHKQQKVGLVGANGCGKSSLFAIILDQLHVDSGDFQIPSGLEIAHVKQETPALSETAIDYVKKGNRLWFEIQQKIQQAERQQEQAMQQQMMMQQQAPQMAAVEQRAAQAEMQQQQQMINQQQQQQPPIPQQ